MPIQNIDMSNVSANHKVRAQYEDLPYPERNPEDEKARISLANVEAPDRMNHYCFNGSKDFSKKIRVLIAGGGTGDSLIQWAVALRNNPAAEIIYIDFSVASRKIAEERLKVRNLEHKATLITDSLLNIPNLNLGKFDIINCSGVLHHLEDPEAGLKVLADSLDDNGAMVVMLYGKYGRLGVYAFQEIMRYINVDATSSQEEINNTKATLAHIGQQNNFYLGFSAMGDLNIDAEIYDIFMHKQDRAYTVKEVYDFAASANLKAIRLTHSVADDLYNPEKYLQQGDLLNKVKKLPVQQQQSIAEVLNSHMNKHAFYLAKSELKKAELSLDLIPSFTMCMPTKITTELSGLIANGGDLINVNFPQFRMSFIKTPHLADIIASIDGKTSLREILSNVMKKSKAKNCNLQTLLEEFRPLYNLLESFYQINLRQPNIPEYGNFVSYQTEKFGHLFKS